VIFFNHLPNDFYAISDNQDLIIADVFFTQIKFLTNSLSNHDFTNRKRYSEFIAGRISAHFALQKAGFFASHFLTVNADKTPTWPAGFCGSISHSKNLAAAIVAKNRDYLSLGLDLEHFMNYQRAIKISSKILTASELANLPADTKQATIYVTAIFSLKESIYKALFTIINNHTVGWQNAAISFNPLQISLHNLASDLINDIELKPYLKINDNHLISAVTVQKR